MGGVNLCGGARLAEVLSDEPWRRTKIAVERRLSNPESNHTSSLMEILLSFCVDMRIMYRKWGVNGDWVRGWKVNRDDWKRIDSGAEMNEGFFFVQSASSVYPSVREPLSKHH